MAAIPDPGQSLAAVSSVDDERDKLPPMFQYGRVETISLAPLQRYRAADSGNSSYSASSNIIFYYETGGAAFLNTQENYLTGRIKITQGVASQAGDYAVCRLDYNTDALFYEQQLQVNGSLVEHLLNSNLYCNVIDLMEGGCPYSGRRYVSATIPAGAVQTQHSSLHHSSLNSI